MPTQLEKLEAHASHLLQGFLSLREKYSLLQPMLYKEEVIDAWGKKRKARGFKFLKHTLFIDCAKDIANLCLDRHETSPSISNIFHALKSRELLGVLRSNYAVIGYILEDEDIDPSIRKLLDESNRKEERERYAQFDQVHTTLTFRWMQLRRSNRLKAFERMRRKVAAHNDISYDGKAMRYKTLDIGSLGLKWKDLREIIDEMQLVVSDIQMVARSTGFAWEMFDEQIERSAEGFWSKE